MDGILERYERCSHSEQLAGANNDSQVLPIIHSYTHYAHAHFLWERFCHKSMINDSIKLDT